MPGGSITSILSRAMWATAFPPSQFISLWHISTLTPLQCFICRLYQEITFTRSVKIMLEYSFIMASVFYFASFYHQRLWSECKLPNLFLNGFCSLLENLARGHREQTQGSPGSGGTLLLTSTSTVVGLHTNLLAHCKTPTDEEHRTPYASLPWVSGGPQSKGKISLNIERQLRPLRKQWSQQRSVCQSSSHAFLQQSPGSAGETQNLRCQHFAELPVRWQIWH